MNSDQDIGQNLKKKLNYVISFNNCINNNEEMIFYFKDKNGKSENKHKSYKTLNTILKIKDSFVVI